MLEHGAVHGARPSRPVAASKDSSVDARMPSTVIRRFDYGPERRELEMIFTTGRRYLYSGVPEKRSRSSERHFRKAFTSTATFAIITLSRAAETD